MEKLNELLEKYFRAETSVAEENELKRYFQSEDVAPEHEMYRPMFALFEEEKTETAEPDKKIISHQKKSTSRFWIRTISYSGIAAALAITLWLQRPTENENYAIISGNRIEDAEYATKYAEKKLSKATEMLRSSMKPMENIEKVRESLKPMQKVSETREKINELQNKLNFR